MSNLTDFPLREWQKKSLPGYVQRFRNGEQVEFTSAFQGSGKTVYSALCFVSSILDRDITDLWLSDISLRYRFSEQRLNHFAIVLAPALSIRDTTLRDWGRVGVKLAVLKNAKLAQTSPEDLIAKGYNGLFCTYQQADYDGEPLESSLWTENALIQFLQRSPQIRIHAILDECHELTIYTKEPRYTKTKDKKNSLKSNANKRAKFFLDNKSLFTKLHLLTGTPIKANLSDLQDPENANRIAFGSYSDRGEIFLNVAYTQEDAIRDGVIVRTEVTSHSILDAGVKDEITGEELRLTKDDFSYYFSDPPFGKVKDAERIERIEQTFLKIYSSTEAWQDLLKIGEPLLDEKRKSHKKAIGVIFCPSRKAALAAHRLIGKDRSILCIGSDGIDGAIGEELSLDGVNLVLPGKLHAYLRSMSLKGELDRIRWIVSCEGLKQGFDYPDAKVSIMVPRLKFLSLTIVSQMIGRTNRSISGCSGLTADCIILECPALEELISLSKDSNYGWISVSDKTVKAIGSYSLDKRVFNARTRRWEKTPETFEADSMKITHLEISQEGRIVGSLNSGYAGMTEAEIRSQGVLWSEIVHRDPDLEPERLPPGFPGVYIIQNAKTAQCLYVGSSSNLRYRIADRGRFRKTKWLKDEGEENVYVSWKIAGNYKDCEDSLKDKYNPKYDREKRRKSSKGYLDRAYKNQEQQ